MFDLILSSHQQSFRYKGTGLPGLNQYLAGINVLAQGHNTVTPVRLEPRPFGLESSTLPLSHWVPLTEGFQTEGFENILYFFSED